MSVYGVNLISADIDAYQRSKVPSPRALYFTINPKSRGKFAIAYATSFSTFANGLRVNHGPIAASSCRFPVKLSLPSLFVRSIVV
jgi:hypothetical protein